MGKKELEAEIKRLAVGGKLPCQAAWRLAEKHNIPKLELGKLLDHIHIKVTDCCLGCF